MPPYKGIENSLSLFETECGTKMFAFICVLCFFKSIQGNLKYYSEKVAYNSVWKVCDKVWNTLSKKIQFPDQLFGDVLLYECDIKGIIGWSKLLVLLHLTINISI